MNAVPFNLAEKLRTFSERWSPRVIAEMKTISSSS